ncbi:MAG: DNA circularization N-terminal domain-containing protein [Filomicrobium sp.]
MLLRDLQSASFKGARFLVPEDEAEEGRNTIPHQYPDSPIRYAEDNGGHAPCFDISGIVHGEGLPGKVNTLRRAFSSPGPGVLRHPWYGTQFCAVDGKIRFSRSDRNSGVVEFDVKLMVTGPPVFPGLLSGIAAVVTGLASGAVTKLFANYGSLLGVPGTNASHVAMSTAIASVGLSLDRYFGSASNSAGRLIDRSGRYARTPSEMSDVLVDAFRAPIDDTTISVSTLLRGFRDVSAESQSILSEAGLIEITTADRAQRQADLMAFATSIEAAAYVSIAEAMAARAYETADQVEADETDLVERFEAIQQRSLDADIMSDMVSVLTSTSEVLQNAAVRLPRTAALNLDGIPANALSYQLYHGDMSLPADTEARIQQLVDLNLSQDPAALVGDVTVLTEA